MLQELVEPDPDLGDKGFRFKHGRVRDVLFDSILSINRRAMHERIARDLETAKRHAEAEGAPAIAKRADEALASLH